MTTAKRMTARERLALRALYVNDVRVRALPLATREGAAVRVGVMDAEDGQSPDACPFDGDAGGLFRRAWARGYGLIANQHRYRGTHASRSLPAEAR